MSFALLEGSKELRGGHEHDTYLKEECWLTMILGKNWRKSRRARDRSCRGAVRVVEKECFGTMIIADHATNRRPLWC